MKAFLRFLKGEDGPTAVEYAVMLALILVAVLTAVAALGNQVNFIYNDTVNEINKHSS